MPPFIFSGGAMDPQITPIHTVGSLVLPPVNPVSANLRLLPHTILNPGNDSVSLRFKDNGSIEMKNAVNGDEWFIGQPSPGVGFACEIKYVVLQGALNQVPQVSAGVGPLPQDKWSEAEYGATLGSIFDIDTAWQLPFFIKNLAGGGDTIINLFVRGRPAGPIPGQQVNNIITFRF